MSYSIVFIPEFKKQAKRLSKKYKSLKTELSVLFEELEQNPTLGSPIKQDIYKIRLAITSKSKGKSGGARVITYVVVDNKTVVLLSIYNKGEKNSISDKEIKSLLEAAENI